MAVPIPADLDPDTPDSERYVRQKLCEVLGNEIRVFRSRNFVLPSSGGRPTRRGEVDFLILDPTPGVRRGRSEGRWDLQERCGMGVC